MRKEKEIHIIDKFKKSGGYLTRRELRTERHRYQLRKLTEQNIVKRIKPGIYYLEEAASQRMMVDIERIIPDGVLCYYSAWLHYELTTQIPQYYHIAIVKNRRVTLPDFPPIHLHYWQEKYVILGKTYQEIEGLNIPITDLEKSVCDAVKFRTKIGMDVCKEILHNYLDRKDRDLDKLMRYAKNMRIATTMKTFISVQP